MDFEKRVYEKEFKLNDTDDSIIEYIRENRENIHKIPIQKIGNELYISPNAIMRLARKLGYSGFSELKHSLQKEGLPVEYETVTSQILGKIPNNIVRTLDIIDENLIKEVIARMDNARKILFVGVGESVYFCELFGKYLRCLNKNVEYFHHIHDAEYMIKNYDENDMVVAISASGKTERVINLAKRGRENKACVVCITHYGENPLSLISDLQLSFWGEKRIVNNYNTTDYLGLLMLIRIISEGFWKEFK